MTTKDFYAMNEILIDGQKYIPLPKVVQIFYGGKCEELSTDKLEDLLSYFGARTMTLAEKNCSTSIYRGEDIEIIGPLFKEFLNKKREIALSKKIDKLI